MPDPASSAATAPADPAGDLACYQALHLAFDATLAHHQRGPRLVAALLAQAVDSVDGNLALRCQGEPAIACRRGCASCCTLRVVATAPEVFGMLRFLRAVVPPLQARGIDLIGRLRAADAATRDLDERRRVALQQPCPFLAQGVCVVHAVRSLACRGHASHDAAACQAAATGRLGAVPHSAGHRLVRALVQNALQSALRDAGLAWQLHELNHALVLAWDAPGAEAAWLAGADVLAAAAVDDVPQAEMAAVFDRLRPAAPPVAPVAPAAR